MGQYLARFLSMSIRFSRAPASAWRQTAAMLSAELATTFAETGICRVDGAFSAEQAEAIGDVVWRHVEQRTGVRRDDPSTWSERLVIGFRRLKTKRVFEVVVGNEGVRAALDAVFGPTGWQPP